MVIWRVVIQLMATQLLLLLKGHPRLDACPRIYPLDRWAINSSTISRIFKYYFQLETNWTVPCISKGSTRQTKKTV